MATAPVAPVFPQAPQVSQFVESSTLSITVLLGVPGVGEGAGAGVGEGAGAGVGDGEGLGVGDGEGDGAGAGEGVGVGAAAGGGVGEDAGAGDGLAPSDGAVELLATMLPPQPVMLMVKVMNAKTKPTEATKDLLQRKRSPRSWPRRSGVWGTLAGGWRFWITPET